MHAHVPKRVDIFTKLLGYTAENDCLILVPLTHPGAGPAAICTLTGIFLLYESSTLPTRQVYLSVKPQSLELPKVTHETFLEILRLSYCLSSGSGVFIA